MAMRNGITSDILRRAGLPHKVIFGLNLPQLTEISKNVDHTRELADSLWNDTEVRESRLLSPMVIPHDKADYDMCIGMATSCRTKEECDVLCFKLLRSVDFAHNLAKDLVKSDDELSQYCGKALLRNLE